MRQTVPLAAASVAAAVTGTASPANAQAREATAAPPAPVAAPHFPPITASNLEGRAFDLPGDLEGEHNVLLVGFAQAQQADMDTWLPSLHALAAVVPTLRVYEMPVAPRRALAMRWMIDGGMRRNIPDRAAREATITLYTDKAALRRSLGLPDEARIYVLLVDRAGAVRWQAAGRYTPEAFAELERALGR